MKPDLKGKAIWKVIWVIHCSEKGAVYTDEGYISSFLFRFTDFQEVPKTNKNIICNFTFLGKNFLE